METLKRTGNNLLTRSLVIAFIFSFLIFFFDNVQTTYNSYTDLQKNIENNKLEKQNIQNQIEEWNRQMSDLEDPDKLELVLRERGYGKDGEILYVYDIPEPVTPIEEVLTNDRSKSVFEYVVEFIVGQEGG
tara:strand:+ start:9800 stop:10192 length:393 start_codon:yes stop_codon:yes gene_type:complete